MQILSFQQIKQIITDIADIIILNEHYLTELDSAIGDGDFGTTLARGFRAIKERQEGYVNDDIGNYLVACATVIAEFCGGTIGPLMTNAFIQAGMKALEKKELSLDELIELIHSATLGIQNLGGAKTGDKTVLDALFPAIETVQHYSKDHHDLSHALILFADEARRAAESTKGMIALKGRAQYLGERSIGYLDPGAVAVAVIAEGLADKYGS